MSKLTEYIGSQFGNPRGIVGFICCKYMNIINKKMYKKIVTLLGLNKNQKLLITSRTILFYIIRIYEQ